MIYLVTGSRFWTNEPLMRERLAQLDKKNDIVVHGGCRGADMMADAICQELGIHTAQVNALWKHYHHAAGPIRNTFMLTLGVRHVLVFHNDLSQSKGTANMVLKATEMAHSSSLKVEICT